MTRSTTRLVTALLVGVGGVVVAVVVGRAAPAVVAAPFLLALAAGGIGGAPAAVRIRAGVAPSRVVEGDEVEVTVELAVSGRPAVVDVWLELPTDLVPTDGTPGRVLALAADERVTLAVAVRGDRWGPAAPVLVRARATDRLGLVSTSRAVTVPGPRVHPRPDRLRALVAPRTTRAVTGAHPSRQRGDGLVFADVRPFVPGDRARAVNWRATARTGTPWVTERHPDRAGDVVIFLDSFAATGDDRDSTLRRAVDLAVTLATRHLGATDRVGLVDLGGVFRWVRPTGGTAQLHRIVDALLDTELVASSADKTVGVVPVRALPRAALVVALSPLLDPRGIAALVDLRARGADLVVVEPSPLGHVRAGPGERGELALRLWRLERSGVRDHLRGLGIAVVAWEPDTPAARVVDELVGARVAVARWAR